MTMCCSIHLKGSEEKKFYIDDFDGEKFQLARLSTFYISNTIEILSFKVLVN